MNEFLSEYFVLLSDFELSALVSAKNRDAFQPELKTYLNASRKLKELRRLSFAPELVEWKPPVFSEEGDGTVKDDTGKIRGKYAIFPLPARPGEPQMALGYDWFWEEFSAFLCERSFWAILSGNQFKVIAKSDEGGKADSCGELKATIKELWAAFWEKLASREHLKKSVEIYLNHKTLFKNQAKAWGREEVPILSADMAKFLIHYYQTGSNRKKLFKEKSIPSAIDSLKGVLEKGSYAQVVFPEPKSDKFVKGGDFFSGRDAKEVACLACGEILPKNDSYKRLAVFVKDADERPQSGKLKDDKPCFCPRCVATVFLCPVKLTPETLTVRFLDPARKELPDSKDLPAVQMELRKYVAQTLHVAAGSFVSLHVNESVDRKPLVQTFGAYSYALWKMALTFSPELFAQGFSVEVYPGEEIFTLPRWQLWLTSALVHWDKVFEYRCYSDKKLRPHFGRFLRLISRGKVFESFYTLLKGGVIEDYSRSWRRFQIQDIWEQFERILSKEEPMPIPDYPKIVGFAGLLLPLAERVENSKTAGNEKKRAVSKLLEEVDRPIQYAYTASRESGARDFIFCRQPRNRYFFEKALELLGWAGEDVEELKREGARIVNENDGLSWARDAGEKIFIGPDQIARVTGALVNEGEKPYQNEADWRAFAYQAKLALWSMFPQHLGSDNQ
ncbi:hypothetical protein [Desulforhabdus amnigena]|jgi:hypothetical protein|uniref:Uncharacterized protein n=1 Tax=Desulforhabdus amnigena TaxID=40218 RepID=A0A9W6FV20_9BACT|nr:hypothetical protein [Desulforhabdus amnigena]GLI35440.1 hypothetical protein DAMNIGENAA_28730 [Desulforhabdus amnigena]